MNKAIFIYISTYLERTESYKNKIKRLSYTKGKIR